MRIVLEAQLSPHEGARYDAFVEDAVGGHFSQTRAWAAVATAGKSLRADSLLVLSDDEVIGAAQVLRPRLGRLAAPIAMLERGPVCRSPRDLARVLPALLHGLRRRGILRVSAMPYFGGNASIAAAKCLTESGFRDVQQASGAHVRTLRLQLRDQRLDALFSGGARESLRRKLKQAEKAGVRVRRGDRSDVAHLQRLHTHMMLAQNKPPKSAAYFQALADFLATSDRGELLLAEHGKNVIAALVAVAHGRLVTFVVGATTTDVLPFSKMASAMSGAIAWAHAVGADAFDFGGIPAQNDADPKRASIAQFKFDFTKDTLDLTPEHARWF